MDAGRGLDSAREMASNCADDGGQFGREEEPGSPRGDEGEISGTIVGRRIKVQQMTEKFKSSTYFVNFYFSMILYIRL